MDGFFHDSQTTAEPPVTSRGTDMVEADPGSERGLGDG